MERIIINVHIIKTYHLTCNDSTTILAKNKKKNGTTIPFKKNNGTAT